jgi:shikimate dehydrogenase
VIATGGGCVTRPENYPLLHQNGHIVWIQRDLSCLPSDGRPLSQRHSAQTLYDQRKGLYEAFADLTMETREQPEQVVAALTALFS